LHETAGRWSNLADGGIESPVELVGKWLVHYKLAKPGAVRTANSCSGIIAVRKYLKKNKAILVTA
jgi:hypothetical protein